MKNQFIDDFTVNEKIDSLFAVIKKTDVRPYKNGYMFTLEVADRTGKTDLSYFGDSNKDELKKLWLTFKISDVVHIICKTQNFNNKITMLLNSDGTIEKTTDYDLEDFISKTEKNIDEMINEFKQIINDINQPNLKQLLNNIFNNSFIKKFSESPAATYYHHNFIGGLLEHILSMIKIAVCVSEIHPKLDKDLLISGCILHDIGKVKELCTTTIIMPTIEGSLLSHISLGYNMINKFIEDIPNFEEILKYKILHMVLSHHGKMEWGSPVEPMFPEAVALHNIDMIDSQIQIELQEKKRDIGDKDGYKVSDKFKYRVWEL